MHTRALAACMLAAAALAGCVADDDDGAGDPLPAGCRVGGVDADGVRLVPTTHDPIEADHDHWDFTLHNLRTCTVETVAHLNLTDGAPHRYIGEMDSRPDLNLTAVAVLLPREGQPGVVLLDTSDRAAPRPIARIEEPVAYPTDVKFSSDGALLLVASQNLPTDPADVAADPAGLASFLGFTVYDIGDPAAPRLVGRSPHGYGGCHMLRHALIGGQDWVFCAGGDVFAYPMLRTPAGVVVLPPSTVLRQEGGAPAISAPGLLGDPTGTLESSAHLDAYVVADGDRTVLLASHWTSGLIAFDVSDPLRPEELGRWSGEGATHYYGAVHSAQAFNVGPQRYVLASPELTSADTVPSLWLLDANDWGAMTLAAEWTAPGDHPSEDLTFTTHQWQVAPTGNVSADEVRVYMTYNHAGVWVLGLGEILAGDAQGAILGFHLARAPLDEAELPPRAVLGSWDVNLVDGHVYASDRATGMWVLRYTGDGLGDPRLNGLQ